MIEPEDLKERYMRKIEDEFKDHIESGPGGIMSREYQQFKKENMPKPLSAYEKLCNLSEKIIKISPKEDKKRELEESIRICHLSSTPEGVNSLSILAPIFVVVIGSMFAVVFLKSTFFLFFFLAAGLFLMRFLAKLPDFFANSWRMKASNQMVLCIFYVVTYMRHTSNLEGALDFASEHLAPPLSMDLKKILWDVETELYESALESLEAYLETWKDWNMEFVESFHLIESSLYEGEEEKRIASLDKSLDVILDGTYEKMLHYAHNLKSPITMLHMLGVIMPILGLVILPLVVSFMDNVMWYHIAALYNVALPISVYYMGKNILSRRPTGYGDTDIGEIPEYESYKKIFFKIGGKEYGINPLFVSIFIGAVLVLIGFSPIIIHIIDPTFDIGFGQKDTASVCGKRFCLLEYREAKENIIGPFGLGASIIGLGIVLGIGVGNGIYYKHISKKLMEVRERSKKLEKEFACVLFQLGNRLGDGIPAEMAVGKVADSMKGTATGGFFGLVSQNVFRLGMSVEQAIFNKRGGALVSFPSSLIESSMKVLVESVKKGPAIAAHALLNVSRYIKEIHRVNERLKDLMADIISSMTSQIKFLTPVIAGIVIGITSMVTTILGKLSKQLANVTAGGSPMQGDSLISMFGQGMPTFYFQLIVGVYVIQIIYILSVLSNGIENGSDKLNERYTVGVNLIRGTVLYCAVSAIVMLLFNLIAGHVLSTTVG